jgi:hypothetical protein
MAQIDNLLLANQAAMAGCSWAASAFAPGGPPANLLAREPSLPLIWTDPGDCIVTCHLAAPTAVRLVWLGYLSCSDAATFRVRLLLDDVAVHDTRVGMTDMACSDGQPGLRHRKYRRHCFMLLDAAVTCDAVEVTVFDAGNTDGRLLLGSLVIADPFQSERNISYGLTPPSLSDPSRPATAAPGQRAPLNRAPYDVAAFQLRFLSEAEAVGSLREFMEDVGTTLPVLAILKPAATLYAERWTIFGLLDAVQPISLPVFDLFATAFRIEELIP